jgi:endo-alpha-1,4-polygalactosaminidase (GH114 family)
VLSLVPLAVGCGGANSACPADAPACSAETGTTGVAAGGQFRGDGSPMPAWGGWAWGSDPADAIAKAGFDWFETGYPGDTRTNDTLRNAGVRPFAYINLGELVEDLKSESGYNGPTLRTNGDWGTYLVDVTNQSWQDWLVRRADDAYRTGSRGVKWDVATPDVAPGKSRDDVNNAIASVMQRIRTQHPDMKFVFNQGFLFALAYPQFVDGVQTEGLFSASSAGDAWLQPWKDPWYWGPQFDQAKKVRASGKPIFIAEYADPSSSQANDLYNAIVAQGFVPYITSESWNVRGRGYNVAPGW